MTLSFRETVTGSTGDLEVTVVVPAKDEAVSAATLALDALLAVEALERMAQSDDPDVLRAIGAPDDAAAAVALRVRAVAVAAADAKKELPAEEEGAAASGEPSVLPTAVLPARYTETTPSSPTPTTAIPPAVPTAAQVAS